MSTPKLNSVFAKETHSKYQKSAYSYIHVLHKQTNELLFWLTPWLFVDHTKQIMISFLKTNYYLTQMLSLDLHVKMHSNMEHI